MERFDYPPQLKKRAAASVTLSVTCFVLFSFFLLVGFGDLWWMPVAWAIVALVCLLLFLQGFLSRRFGTGFIELDDEIIRLTSKRKAVALSFDEIHSVRFTGYWFPRLILSGKGGTIVIGKSLTRYPRLWGRIRLRIPYQIPQGTLTVRLNKTDLFGVFVAMQFLLFVAAVGAVILFSREMISMLSTVISLVLFIAALVLFFAFSFARLGVCKFGENEVVLRTLTNRRTVLVSSIARVLLSCENARLLVTGYRYRGPDMTTAVRMSSIGSMLRVTLQTDGEPLAFDETVTNYPIELLFEAILLRYHLSGDISNQ